MKLSIPNLLKVFRGMREPTGFDVRDPALRGDISFVNATRTFTIEPQAGMDYFNYWVDGKEYRKTEADTVVITDVEGEHFIYYSNEDPTVLVAAANPDEGTVSQVIRRDVLAAYIRWDATNNEYVMFNDERHLNQMDGSTHVNLHFTRGCQYIMGLALGDFVIDQNGDDDEDAQFSVSFGQIADEDITSTNAAILSTAGLPIIYKDGASGDWRRTTEPGFPVLTTDPGTPDSGRLVWNEFTGGAWQLTEVTSGDFVLCHIITTNGAADGDRVFAIVGQNEYGNKRDARLGAVTEKDALITSGLPGPEYIFVGTVIFQTRNTSNNKVKGNTVTTDEGDNYINWLTTESTSTSTPGDHGNLTGLNDDDHTQYQLRYDRTVSVDPDGNGDYTSIQDAIDSITDAASDKIYEVRVYPGEYTEQVTLPDYINLVGTGAPRAVVIKNTTAPVITMTGSNRSDLRQVTVELTSTVDNANAIEITGGTHLFFDCVLLANMTGNYGSVIKMTGGLVQINTGAMSYTQTGATTGTLNNHSLISTSGTSQILLRGINGIMNVESTTDNVVGIVELVGSIGQADWQNVNMDINVSGTNTGYTAVYYAKADGVLKFIDSSILKVTNSGSGGNGYIYVTASSGGATLRSSNNTCRVTGFTNNRYADIGLGDTVISKFEAVEAAKGVVNAGTFKQVNSPANGDFKVSGDIEADSRDVLRYSLLNS